MTDVAPATSPAPTARVSWHVVGASVAGTRHVAAGIECDDAYGWSHLSDDAIVVAVADGAGSRPGTSKFASIAACRAVINSAHEKAAVVATGTAHDLEALMRELYEDALAGLLAEGGRRQLTIDQLACTLSVAVVRPDLAVIGNYGDCIIVARQRDEVMQHIPQIKGGYANLTDFLVNNDKLSKLLRIKVVAGVDAVVLSTDGMEYKILEHHDRTVFEPFFDAVWSGAASGAIDSDNLGYILAGIEDDQTGDDKTIVAAVFGAGSSSSPRTAFSVAPSEPVSVAASPVVAHADAAPPVVMEAAAEPPTVALSLLAPVQPVEHPRLDPIPLEHLLTPPKDAP